MLIPEAMLAKTCLGSCTGISSIEVKQTVFTAA
jgi:hypothetical protein